MLVTDIGQLPLLELLLPSAKVGVYKRTSALSDSSFDVSFLPDTLKAAITK